MASAVCSANSVVAIRSISAKGRAGSSRCNTNTPATRSGRSSGAATVGTSPAGVVPHSAPGPVRSDWPLRTTAPTVPVSTDSTVPGAGAWRPREAATVTVSPTRSHTTARSASLISSAARSARS
jgi:hypothetical protein